MRITRRRGVRFLLQAPVLVPVVVAALALIGVSLYPWSAPRSPHVRTVVALRAVPPRVLGVRPDVVRGSGGTKVLVTGSGFTASTQVTVGGRPAEVLSVRDPDTLVVRVPPGAGSEVVRAITAGGTSAENPRSIIKFESRVLIVGDSLGIDLEWGFTPALDERDDLTVTDDSVGSTGLVRSDYYNWPAHLRADIAHVKPDVVVTLFGTNDQQDLPAAGGLAAPATSAWNRVYAGRVRQIAAIVRAAGATLVWVGLPRMGPQSVLSVPYVEDVVKLDRDVVASLQRATYVDTYKLFTNGRGAYTPYVEVAPRVWQLGHAPDGTHLTTAGAAVIDALAAADLRHYLTAG